MKHRHALGIVIFYVLLACALTYPLVLEPRGLLEIRHESVPPIGESDVLQALYKIAWHHDALTSGGDLLATSTTYYPQGLTPAQDNFMPTYSLTGALIHYWAPLTVTHTLLILAALTLSGITCYLLAREFAGEGLHNLFAGLVYMSLPYLTYQAVMGHANIMQLQWIPLILLYTRRLLTDPTGKNGILVGVTLALQFLSSTQVTVYLTIMIIVYVIGLSSLTNMRKSLKEYCSHRLIMPVLATFFLFGLPYLWGILQHDELFTRTLDTNRLPIFTLELPEELVLPQSMLAVGAIPLLLAVAAAVTDIRRKTPERLALYLLAIAGLLLAIGPVTPWAPYTVLYRLYLPLQLYRVPMRILPFAYAAIAVLAAWTLAQATQRQDCRKKAAVVGAVCLLHLLTFVYAAPYLSSHAIAHPPTIDDTPLLAVIADDPRRVSVAEYPITFCCACSYRTLLYGKPLVGGCAAYPPQEYLEFTDVCGLSLVNLSSPACRQKVVDYNLTYLLVHHDHYEDWPALRGELDAHEELALLERTDDVSLYRIDLAGP